MRISANNSEKLKLKAGGDYLHEIRQNYSQNEQQITCNSRQKFDFLAGAFNFNFNFNYNYNHNWSRKLDDCNVGTAIFGTIGD